MLSQGLLLYKWYIRAHLGFCFSMVMKVLSLNSTLLTIALQKLGCQTNVYHLCFGEGFCNLYDNKMPSSSLFICSANISSVLSMLTKLCYSQNQNETTIISFLCKVAIPSGNHNIQQSMMAILQNIAQL